MATARTLLLVEDEAVIALDLKERATRLGYEVVDVVPNAERAVAAASERHPDVVLMDIRLHGERDGVDAATEIHRQLDIPIVFLTGYADPLTLKRVMMVKPSGYLLKPVDEHELEVTLAAAIDRAWEVARVRTSEEWLRSILQGVSDAVIATTDGNVRYVNSAAEHLTGWTKDRAAGRELAQVFRTTGEAEPASQPRDPPTAALPPRSVQVALVARDGTERVVEVERSPLGEAGSSSGGEVLVFREVGERQRAEEALRERERSLRLLVDAVKDYAIFMLSPQGRVVSWNTGAQAVKGYAAEEILARDFSIFYTQEDRAAGKPGIALRTAEQLGNFTEEGWRVRKDGTRFWAFVDLSAVRDAAGKLVGFAKVTRDITERHRAEEELRLREERFRALAESMVEAVITTNEQGIITYMNRGAESMFGCAARNGVGQPLAILMPERYRELERLAFERLRATGVSEVIGKISEHWGLRADGTEFPIELSVAAWAAGGQRYFTGVVRDITERKRAQKALTDSEERVRLALTSALLGVWDYHPMTGESTYDDRCRALWGAPPGAEVNHEMWLAGIHPDDRQRVVRAMDPDGGGHVDVEFRTIGLTDRVERWLSLRAKVTRDAAGRRTRCLGAVRDITEHRHMEELRERFTGILAHDLRSPLSAILMVTQLMLARGSLSLDVSNGMAIVARNALRMGGMIEQLIEYTRARFGGTLLIRRERVDLAVLCREAAADAEAANPGRRVSCTTRGDCVGVWCPIGLSRVVQNLIQNALKYGFPRSPVEVVLRHEGAQVVLEVRNEGEPISADTRRVLFEAFRRGEHGARETGKGTAGLGLGLYISKEIVVAHGGEIDVRSSAEQGTAFAVRLPCTPPEPTVASGS